KRNIDTLTNGIESLLERTKTKQHFKASLKDRTFVDTLVETINTFVSVDTRFTSGARKIGIILRNVLEKQGYDEQIVLIRAMCLRQGIAPIKDKNGKEI